MHNPIKDLPKIIKTKRLEMRQLDATPENAKLVFDAVKNENPKDFFYNQIGNTNIIPASADEMLKQMQCEAKYSTENTRSANSIKSSGFHLDGIARQAGFYPDNRLYDNMFWSKLKTEYKK